MNFGICSSFDKERVENFFDTGADYLEINASAVSSLCEGDFEALRSLRETNEIDFYSCNNLCPGDLRLTGEVDFKKIEKYAEKTFSRLSSLGIKMLVFGSGKAKKVPEGFPVSKAWKQLFEVGRIFASEASKYGQTIAVEGLRREEVNIVNTLEDVNYYIENVGMDNLGMNVDFFHMYKNGEPLSEIEKYGDKIVHAHICNRNRGMPSKDDESFIISCIESLKKIGYTKNVSFEGSLSEDMNEVKKMIDFFKRYGI